MDGGSVSEHCFNFQDAKHEEGTNKYTFKYPSSWHLMDTACDLSVGIRGILLKPGPVDANLNNLWIIGYGDVAYAAGTTTIKRIVQPNPIISPGGNDILPERLNMSSSIIVDESCDMVSYCKQMNDLFHTRFKDLEQIGIGAYNDSTYLGMCGNSFNCLFTKNGTFTMGVSGEQQYLVYTNTAALNDKKLAIERTDISLFDEGFHEMLGLDPYDPYNNLNQCFKNLLWLDAANDGAGYLEESLRQNRNGIFFGKRTFNPKYAKWRETDYTENVETTVSSPEAIKKAWPAAGSTTTKQVDQYTVDIESCSKDGLTYRYESVFTKEQYRNTVLIVMVYDVDTYYITKTSTTKMEVYDSGPDDGVLRKDDNGNYNYIVEHVHSAFDLNDGSMADFMFKMLEVRDVWSRKGLLVTSSIAEFDNRNYLGYTSFTANNTNAVYMNPKMYELTSRSDDFWIEIFDSYTNNKIELPSNSNVLIEACLYQRDKRSFNRQ